MKTVYLLGAGSSIGNTQGKFPGIDTIFRTAKELGIVSESTKKIRTEYAALSKYVLSLLKKYVLLKSEKINIETLMTFIELEIESSNDSYYLDLKSKLIKLIRDVIIQASGAYWKDEENSEYKMLAHILQKEDTVITYNWDTMLDDVLGRKFLISEKTNPFASRADEFKDNQYYNFLYDISAVSFQINKHLSIDSPYSVYSNSKGEPPRVCRRVF